MHLGMPECHKAFMGHCDLDLWPSFQDLLCPEHISYIIWCRNPKFGVVIPLGMAEWCIPFWVTLTLTLTSGLISSFSCYITAIFPQMWLMLDQFLWGHSSHVCDISCYFIQFQIHFLFPTWRVFMMMLHNITQWWSACLEIGGCRFELTSVTVLCPWAKDTFILAWYWFNPGRPIPP